MRRRESSAGFSLVELLVAMTILALATAIAFTVYDSARRSYEQGSRLAEQQQLVRIGLALIVSDLQMAGLNVNPDGDRFRPDEQIEFASETALILRADFDASDAAARSVPEVTLAGSGSAFLSVSTGNDEVRGYVLAKQDGSSGDTFTFEADVGQAVRDGSLEQVQVGAIDLDQDVPPYTLYRVVLDNDSAQCCSGGFVNRVPVADNIRSLRFRYFDTAGQEVTPPGGDDTPAAIAARAAIRRVEVELEGLTRDPDPGWVDADDPDPLTRRYRKFRLNTEVTPRNLGISSIRDFSADATPPAQPATPQAYPGHCGGLLVDWTPNPPQDDVAYYRLIYGPDPLIPIGQRSARGTWAYIGGLTDGTPYYVAVQAVDRAGNRSPASGTVNVTTANLNTPENVPALDATDGVRHEVDLTWDAVAYNSTDTFGDPNTPVLRDLAGYRVYRSPQSGFTHGPGNRIADETQVGALVDPGWVDSQVVSCKPYYYRVAAVDGCGVEGPTSPESPGSSWSDVDPIAPTGLQAFEPSYGVNHIIWDPVHTDVNGGTVHVQDYNVYVSDPVPIGDPPPTDFVLLTRVNGATEYDHVHVPTAGATLYYRVTAVDACSPPNESAPSDPATGGCVFSGQPAILAPDWLDVVNGSTNLAFEVQNGVGIYVAAHVTFTHRVTGETFTRDFALPGPQWNVIWNFQQDIDGPGLYSPGEWDYEVTIDQDSSGSICSATATSRIVVDY